MSATPFQCSAVEGMPFGGAEVLIVGSFFMFLTVCFCVTFMDVAAKQMWPGKWLDPAVQRRVAAIQARFPKLGKTPGLRVSPEDDLEDEETVIGLKDASDTPDYTHVVSQEAYIAGRSIDEDLITMLANNDAYGTVSSYCACTVRGYAMLSTTLLVAGVSLGFLWCHNAIVYHSAGDSTPGKISLLGYMLVFLTGIVMTNPNGLAVNRDANIALWSNVPLKICGTHSNPTLKLHDVGIVGFCLVPLVSHIYVLVTEGKNYPNYTGAWTGAICQLVGAVCFVLPGMLKNKFGITPVMSKKLAIIGEIIAVFAAFLSYLQFEFYATSACANATTQFHSLLLGAAFAPFGFIAKHYYCAPQTFPTKASVLLMNGNEPVATSGPAPVLVFDADKASTADVPHLN